MELQKQKQKQKTKTYRCNNPDVLAIYFVHIVWLVCLGILPS
jgi:hypothetical protein